MSMPDRSKKPAPPNPAGSSPGKTSKSGALTSFVQLESLLQLALLLPAATFVGWAIGLALDHWLHQHWIYIAGLILGAIAGFVQVFRVVLALNKE